MKRDQAEQDGQQQLDKVRKTLRGRAEKACVRCRAKKRTCDGGNPCMRCKESHSACYFSDWHYTVPYPREYVEYLEEQQEQLSSGLLTMYRLLKESNIQTVPPLPEQPQAQDLLSALRGLKLGQNAQSSGHNRTGHTPQSPSHFVSAINAVHSGDHSQYQSQGLQNHLESASRSPTSSSMYVPSLPSTQDLNASASSRIPTSLPGSFVAGPFGSFDYARHAQNPTFLSHRHSLPTEYSTAAALGPPSGLAPMAPVSSSWHHSTNAMSPVASLQMSSPTTVMNSPQSRDGGGGVFEPENNLHAQHQQHHPQQQQHWQPASWPGGMEGGVGMFTNILGGNNHDSAYGMEAESIEQRGEIVLPHDPRVL